MSAKRITGRAPIALCAFTAALILTIAPPAVAAGGDSERGYPEVTAAWSAPNWYSVAPAFNDYPRYPPSPMRDPSLEHEGTTVYYQHPGGGGPGIGQGDLSLRIQPSGETDSGQVDFSLLPMLTADLGTEFVEVALLPHRPKQTLFGGGNAPTTPPIVTFEGSILTMTRPTCGVDSLMSYESDFQIALLATNGFKYLADVRVSFDANAKSKCSEKGEAREPAPTTKSESGAPAASEPPTDEQVEPEQSAEDSEARNTAEAKDEFDLWMIAVAFIILLGLLAIAYMRSRLQRAPAFDPDTYIPPLSRQQGLGEVSAIGDLEDD